MRFIIMHKTNAHWETGPRPGPGIISRVGALIGEMNQANVFRSGEGLRPTSEGVRLKFAGGTRTITPGPFKGDNELPAAFSIVRMPSLDEAIDWATQLAQILGDLEIDIRPVVEPWDLGIVERPRDLTSYRYMVLRKGTAATESGAPLSGEQQEALARLLDQSTREGVHVVTENMGPSRRGRRYKNDRNGVSVYDGPFAESKELVGGYVIIDVASLDDADPWMRKYLDIVGTSEADLRELE